MAITTSTEYDKFNTIGLTTRPDSIRAEGRARFLNDDIVLAGDESTEVVTLLPIPKGALIDPSKSFFIQSASVGMTVDVGTGADDDALADGVALTSAGTKPFNANGVTLVESDGITTLTFKSGTAAAGTVRVSICYYVR